MAEIIFHKMQLRSIKERRAAIELSIGTIIIIVLGVSMLILGMVLVRSIMCKSIGLTTNIGGQVESEINKIFGDSGNEVACIGDGDEPVKLVPGKENIISCIVKAPAEAQYTFNLLSVSTSAPGVTQTQLNSWITKKTETYLISPTDRGLQKVIRISLPDNAPEIQLSLKLEVKKTIGGVTSTVRNPNLDFQISRLGFIRASMC